MMIAGAVVAVPTIWEGDIGVFAADITLILPPFQKVGDGKGRVTVSIFTDPSPRDPVHGHALEFIDGDWLDISSLDVTPGNVEG